MKRRTLLSAFGAIPFIGGAAKAAGGNIVTAADRGNISLDEMKAAMESPPKVEDIGEPLFDIHQWNMGHRTDFNDIKETLHEGRKSYMGIEVGRFGAKMAVTALLTERMGHVFAEFKVFCGADSPAMSHPILGRPLNYEREWFTAEREFGGTYITKDWDWYIADKPAKMIANDLREANACLLHDPWSASQVDNVVRVGVEHQFSMPVNSKTMDPSVRNVRDLLDNRRFHHNGNAVVAEMVRYARVSENQNGLLMPRRHPEVKSVGVLAVFALLMANAARLADKESA